MNQLEQYEADYVIVGSGAGGATAARVLSDRGFNVLILEEGRQTNAAERQRALLHTMSRSVRDFGTQTTLSPAPMPLLQGRCVGGSTAINSGIIWRLPDDVRRDWIERFGLGQLLEEKKLYAAFEQIENELGIGDTSEGVLGENARLMDKASKALGLPGRPTRRNAKDCVGSGRCLQGCSTFARQSMDASYIPMAQKQGALLLEGAKARRIAFRGARATAIEGRRTPDGRRFIARAKKGIILSCGAIQTPSLLLRSGLRGRVGMNFQAHPGMALVGRFAQPVSMGFGATQGYEVPMRERGYKLESLSLPPEMLAVRLPGFGKDWQERLAHMGHFAQWCVQVRMKAVGRVHYRPWSGVWVTYQPTAQDLAKLREALALLSRMMFAAGAVEVYPGVADIPQVLRRKEDVRFVKGAPLKLRTYHLVASHLFGTAAAGYSNENSVCDAQLKVRQAENLFVMDASALPTNLGVNPQHSIMGLVWRACETLC